MIKKHDRRPEHVNNASNPLSMVTGSSAMRGKIGLPKLLLRTIMIADYNLSPHVCCVDVSLSLRSITDVAKLTSINLGNLRQC